MHATVHLYTLAEHVMCIHSPMLSLMWLLSWRRAFLLVQLDFAVQRVLIPEGLRLTFKDLALGRARQTPGQGVPFVVGAQGAGCARHAACRPSSCVQACACFVQLARIFGTVRGFTCAECISAAGWQLSFSR